MNKFIAILALCLLHVVAHAQELEASCDLLVNNGVRNGISLFSESDARKLMHDTLCKEKYSDYKDFKSKSQSFGVDVPVGDAILGLSGSESEKNQKFEENYEKACSSALYYDKNYDRFTLSSQTVSDSLVNAFNTCYKIYAENFKSGATVYVDLQDDMSEFSARLKTAIEKAKPVEITSITPKSVSCLLNGRPIKPGERVSMGEETEVLLSCKKPPMESIKFVVATTAGITKAVDIPGFSSVISKDKATIDDLRKSLNRALEGTPVGKRAPIVLREFGTLYPGGVLPKKVITCPEQYAALNEGAILENITPHGGLAPETGDLTMRANWTNHTPIQYLNEKVAFPPVTNPGGKHRPPVTIQYAVTCISK
ncbi:hypothetical protein HNP46_000373 [Pseudomonas nitritireducens]|uniref:Uncharacterized protein n=1 Tax=Pseudomonas nitroreducens TaxID=46680 RepID=A0A7W7NZT5_PSENT|nr:hypothetical protein [Pseudomonas nitritireducens]MBB4861562.1 hypothetical protein [Pseudomonas nitritireducens]